MPTIISFFIPAIPRGQARARHTSVNGLSRTYKSAAQKQDEQTLQALMMPYRPEKPLQGALSLRVTAVMPIPKSKPKKWQSRASQGHVRFVGKPDVSNMLKHIEDVMQSIRFFEDDKQIVRALIAKRYGSEPGWYVLLEELPEVDWL